ncbi:T9SS type A sorting domain-containing protein [Confluentibacter flavum]|uniref:Secretion system C-terminal sorting domain-containing protein n=1 Tax=Confluentibacter flavum TaxID=1909700 RepID=A0A2N3HHY5_9FLAO|nr:T9SS type A sorting domain-containing protein [Confluentibacter flavum]PKQ44576.1 hypothetical protein CSW08_12500 [Confluentibacter flavum]
MTRLLFLICFIICGTLYSQTICKVIKSGSWYEPSNWDNYPDVNISSNEEIIIPKNFYINIDSGYITNNGKISITGGTLNIYHGKELWNNGIVENITGSISSDGTIRNGNIIINNSGLYNGNSFYNHGTLTNNGRFYNTGSGKITNTGLINGSNILQSGNFTNAGNLSPGNSPGTYILDNDYTHQSTANLNIEIGGKTVGTDYDQLSISGQASLNGSLTITLIENFQPEIGDSFNILTSSNINGSFVNINKPDLVDKDWLVTYNSDSVSLSVVSSLSVLKNEDIDSSYVYPNPTSNKIYVESKSPIAKLKIYNQFGKVVLLADYQDSVDVSSLYSGLYFITIENSYGYSETKKFVKE